MMQSLRVLVMCCGIMLVLRSAFMRRELGDRFEHFQSCKVIFCFVSRKIF